MATPGYGRDGAAATAAAAAAAGAGASAAESDQDLDPRHSLVQAAARQLARAAALAQAQQQVHIVHLTLLANTSCAGAMPQKAGAVTESCVCRLLLMCSQWAHARKWCRLSQAWPVWHSTLFRPALDAVCIYSLLSFSTTS